MKIPCALICCLFFHPQHQDGYNWISADTTFDSAIVQRHVSPVVTIPGALPSSGINGGALSSAAQPGFVSVVPYGPMAVVVNTPVEITAVTGVELFLDGRAVDTSRFNRDQSNSNTYQFDFFCPSPGKHAVQARYLADNIWSNLSPPLFFQIRFPERPKIIAMSDADSGDHGGPLNSEPVRITGNTIRLKLAQVGPADFIDVYVDGKKISPIFQTASSVDNCCIDVGIANCIVPGIHEITVRAIAENSPCSLASQASAAVKFHYYNEGEYVLGPGSGWVFEDRSGLAPKKLETLPEPLPQPKRDDSNPESEMITPEFPPSNPGFGWRGQLPAFHQRTLGNNPNGKVVQARFVAEITADDTSIAENASDTEKDIAEKAKRDTTKFWNQLQHANKLYGEIKELELAVAETADRAQYYSELANHEFDRAFKSEQAIPPDYADLRKKAESKRLAAYIESDKAKMANDVARNLANHGKSLLQKPDGPANALERANQHRLDVIAHARKVFELVKAEAKAKSSENPIAAAKAREDAKKEASSAKTSAESLENIANWAQDHSSSLNDLKALMAQNLKDVQQQRHVAQEHAQLAMHLANAARQFEIDFANVLIEKIDMNMEQLDNSQRSVNLSLVSAEGHFKAASDASVQGAKSASQAMEYSISAATSNSNAVSSNTTAHAALVRTEAARHLVDSAFAAFQAAEFHYSETKKHSEWALTQSDEATRISRFAEGNLDEVRQLLAKIDNAVRDAKGLAEIARTDARAGNVDEVEKILKQVEEKRTMATAAATSASNSALSSKSHAGQAASQSANAALNAIQARLQYARTAKYAGDARFAADEANAVANIEQQRIQADRQTISEKRDFEANFNLATKQAESGSDRHYFGKLQAIQSLRAARSNALAASANQIDIDLKMREWKDSDKRSFYFASAAHFPIREFGSQGQLIEKEGVVVYEDMVFTFDENGDYKINFVVSTPILPTNLMLQFQVQDQTTGHWFTLTMPQRHIDPGDNGLREMHLIEFEGDSEILKRYFTSICKVRRIGSAQFGFGLETEEHQRTRFK